jgi:hypothetical protein
MGRRSPQEPDSGVFDLVLDDDLDENLDIDGDVDVDPIVDLAPRPLERRNQV